MASLFESLDRILNDLKRAGDIRALAVVSREGLPVTSLMPPDIHAETFAIMSATMLGAAETAALEMKQAIPDRLIVETDESKLLIMGAGDKMMLVVLAGSKSGVENIITDMDQAILKIKGLLKEIKRDMYF
jgi:predicted regulator of Ras-like GTPase activity (Roadblock/LC7/MglB family)